mmetsp:Transcript_6321/g.14584  ORF Transcript_6321/g.14584 Transcript_6321/m.14584 type:complete len:302 (-) Transcript_6321:135-1040(-)
MNLTLRRTVILCNNSTLFHHFFPSFCGSRQRLFRPRLDFYTLRQIIRSWYPVRRGLFPQRYRNTPPGAGAYTVLANIPRVSAQNEQASSRQKDRLTDDRFPGTVFDCLKFGPKQHCLLPKQTQCADWTFVAFVVDMRRYAIALSVLINYATIWLDFMREVPLVHQMRHQLHQNWRKFWHQSSLAWTRFVEVEKSPVLQRLALVTPRAGPAGSQVCGLPKLARSTAFALRLDETYQFVLLSLRYDIVVQREAREDVDVVVVHELEGFPHLGHCTFCCSISLWHVSKCRRARLRGYLVEGKSS